MKIYWIISLEIKIYNACNRFVRRRTNSWHQYFSSIAFKIIEPQAHVILSTLLVCNVLTTFKLSATVIKLMNQCGHVWACCQLETAKRIHTLHLLIIQGQKLPTDRISWFFSGCVCLHISRGPRVALLYIGKMSITINKRVLK